MIKRGILIFCIITVLLTVFMPILPLQGEGEVYNETIRLHVLANSDSQKDQELKLKIKDEILKLLAVRLENVNDKDTALRIIKESISEIQQTAKNEISSQGYNYPCTVSVTEEKYPEKEYNGVTLPSGKYLSLRVLIGNAEGQNWWCVLFPTLCTTNAKPKQKLKEAGFTEPQIRILTEDDSPRYKLRFKILEIFNG
ncbi:MAG: stage II sporulation protein R [Clostridia bacterium]|nr:stage II sporulation protein R [Clostridia bacterium]